MNKKVFHILCMLIILLSFAANETAAEVKIPYEFKSGEVAKAAEVNANFIELKNAIEQLERSLQNRITALEAENSTLGEENRTLKARIAELQKLITELEVKITKISSLEEENQALKASIAELQEKKANNGDISNLQAQIDRLKRSTPLPTIATPPITPTPQSFEMEGFTFTMQSCKRSDKNIICSAEIVSNKEDIRMYLKYQSTITDDLGNTYYAEYVQLGGLRARYPNAVLDKFFVGVPKVVVSFFKDVSPEAKMITTFGINFSGFGVQFLNIPILASN